MAVQACCVRPFQGAQVAAVVCRGLFVKSIVIDVIISIIINVHDKDEKERVCWLLGGCLGTPS